MQRECLAYAIAGDVTDGVWGALTARERASMVAAGLTAEAVLEHGRFGFAGLRMMRERELARRAGRGDQVGSNVTSRSRTSAASSSSVTSAAVAVSNINASARSGEQPA